MKETIGTPFQDLQHFMAIVIRYRKRGDIHLITILSKLPLSFSTLSFSSDRFPDYFSFLSSVYIMNAVKVGQ